jgi:excisionase family DNA binding protein
MGAIFGLKMPGEPARVFLEVGGRRLTTVDKVFFYSLHEAAEKLDKTEEDVQELVKRGRLVEFRDGRKRLVHARAVEELIAAGRQESAG